LYLSVFEQPASRVFFSILLEEVWAAAHKELSRVQDFTLDSTDKRDNIDKKPRFSSIKENRGIYKLLSTFQPNLYFAVKWFPLFLTSVQEVPDVFYHQNATIILPAEGCPVGSISNPPAADLAKP
jgi:hypothetical protein